jgi:hypothetical protein
MTEKGGKMIQCAFCNQQIDESWKFCPLCRGRIILVCPECNTKVSNLWQYCVECGNDLKEEAKNQKPTVAKASVKGNQQ